jgi:hypothetical protein
MVAPGGGGGTPPHTNTKLLERGNSQRQYKLLNMEAGEPKALEAVTRQPVKTEQAANT